MDSVQRARRPMAPDIAPARPPSSNLQESDPGTSATAELQDQFGNSIMGQTLQGQDPLGGALMGRMESPEMGAMGNGEMQEAMSSANAATETELEGDDGSESEVEAATRDEAGEGMESAETENLGPKKEAIQKQTSQGAAQQEPAQQGPKNDGHLPRDEHGNVKLD